VTSSAPPDSHEVAEAPKAEIVPTPRRLPQGRPFPKGVSGNPGGRPRAQLEQVRKAARAHGVEAIEKLVELMRTASPKVAYLAAEALLARGFGRPALTVETPDGAAAAVAGVVILPALDVSTRGGGDE